jgi:transcriptional regulator with XRE-family HTH domain
MPFDKPRKQPVRRRPKSDSANPIDVSVGGRIKLRRTLLGLSQERLGDAIGLTFQQVQKYERGANRVGASRLWELSHVLDVPIAYFFEGIPACALDQVRRLAPAAQPATIPVDPMGQRETLELARAYYRISDPKIRRSLLELVKSFEPVAPQEPKV